ncbi:uncharacterized protein [Porites lutea]|uniref:uncharacterized protein n=1 Tax=Porites lutea TaxID=51062 RepID=UPI003CC5A091
MKDTKKIKVAGALISNSDNSKRLQDLKVIVSEPDDAITTEFNTSNVNNIADQLADKVKRLVACKVKYTVEVFTPQTFVNREYKLTVRIEGQNNQKTKDQELIDKTQVTEGALHVIKADFFDLDVGSVETVILMPSRKLPAQDRDWTLKKIEVTKGGQTFTVQFNDRCIPTWPVNSYSEKANNPTQSTEA